MPGTSNVAHLKNLLRSGDCVAFLGSGVSTFAGFPTGPMIAGAIAAELGSEYDGPSDDLEVVSSAAEALRGRNYLIQALRKHVSTAKPTSLAHDRLAEYRLRGYITTNWDTLLEDALVSAGVEHTVARSDDDVPLLGSTPVVKLHGCVTRQPSIVATSLDFVRAPLNRPALFERMRGLMTSHPVVYLGFRLADWDFRASVVQIASAHGNLVPKSYAVQRSPRTWEVAMWSGLIDVVEADISEVLDL